MYCIIATSLGRPVNFPQALYFACATTLNFEGFMATQYLKEFLLKCASMVRFGGKCIGEYFCFRSLANIRHDQITIRQLEWHGLNSKTFIDEFNWKNHCL
mmetsp:Transcript_24212/g.30856  ORF Transcript_24212/g.30856 Transcript_24212/m.30856 type:complete len:100 (-) Transcript_24212:676-975(-)